MTDPNLTTEQLLQELARLRMRLGEFESDAAAEEALRANAERYRLVADYSYDWEYWLDPHGRVLYMSPSCLRITGYRADEFCADPELLERIVYEADRAAFHAHNCEARESREALALEYRIVRPDGEVCWVEHRCQPVRSEDWPSLGRRVSNRDITDRKRIQEALQAAHRQTTAMQERLVRAATEWQTTFDAIEDLVMLLDRDFRILQVNAAARAFFQLPRERLLGQACYRLMHGTDRPTEGCPLAVLWKTRMHAEAEVFDPDRQLWLHVSVDPLLSDADQLTGAVHIVRNITARKQVELSLRQARAELEQKVQERTADLHRIVGELHAEIGERQRVEEQLRAANTELEQRTRQLRALASELTQAEQRERHRLALTIHDHLQQLLVGARYHLGVLGYQVGGNQPLAEGLQRLDDLLQEAVSTSRSLAHELSPPILYEGGLAPALEWLGRWMQEKHGLQVTVNADQANNPQREDITVLLFQAARELLFNVVKHAQVRQAAVQLDRLDVGHVRLVVADEGHGFDPGAGRNLPAGGGGLGLFSIRERLDLLGGELCVQSVPGQGSRFTLIAPADADGPVPPVRQPGDSSEPPADSSPPPRRRAGRGGKTRKRQA